jgi:hypothetical protein
VCSISRLVCVELGCKQRFIVGTPIEFVDAGRVGVYDAEIKRKGEVRDLNVFSKSCLTVLRRLVMATVMRQSKVALGDGSKGDRLHIQRWDPLFHAQSITNQKSKSTKQITKAFMVTRQL